MKIGFIGAGNMATAIASGIVDRGVVQGSDVVVHDVHTAGAQALAELDPQVNEDLDVECGVFEPGIRERSG